MFRFVLPLILIVFALHSNAQVVLEETSFDLGEISLLNEDVIDINLSNNTEKRLFIIKLVSEDHVQIKFTSRTIQPGESEFLRIKMNPSKTGSYHTNVQLFFGQNQEPINLSFSAEVLAIPENQLQACPDFSGRHAASAAVPGGYKRQEKGDIQSRLVGVFHEADLQEYLLAKKDEIEEQKMEEELELTELEEEQDVGGVEPGEIYSEPEVEFSEKEVDEVASNSGLLDNSYRPNNIVFLLDASTSMQKENRMDLLKAAMIELLLPMREIDQIAIVSYAGEADLLLPSTPASDKEAISRIINTIPAEGSTNAVKGLRMALQVAERNFIEGGNNQIFLATDGDFDIGSKNTRTRNKIEKHAEQQIYISVIGIKNARWTNKSLNEIATLGKGNLLSLKSDKNLDIILEEVKSQSLQK